MTLTYEQLSTLGIARGGAVTDAPCPICGPGRRKPENRRRKVFRVWYQEPGFASYCCARCGEKGWARDRAGGALESKRHRKVRFARRSWRRQWCAPQRPSKPKGKCVMAIATKD